SRTPQTKRRVYKPIVESSEESLGEKDASKHGRNSDKVTTASETVTTASVNPEDSTVVDVSVGSPTRLVDDLTTDDVTLAET
ncbi:hypothetical protein Tco_0623468, partial [Tanacetum coccineum]